jgi:hypothetical protein
MEFIACGPVLLPGRAAWKCRVTGEKNMTKFATLALVVAIAAAGMAGSAMAQTGGTSPSVAPAPHKAKASAQQRARPLYNMAPGSAPVNGRDDPVFTGGGSLGYNRMIYNW